MENTILLNIESKETRYAHLVNGKLVDLMFERKRSRQLTGNIYRGRVTNILHNIQSAFIDIGESENGFIHMSDILENKKKFEQMFDVEVSAEEVPEPSPSVDIEQALQIDQPVLVQVIKEPIGSKGARLTSNVSVAGRYLVMFPNSTHRGISKKIDNKAHRERLKKLLQSFELPSKMGLICRTASIYATDEQLIEEVNELHTIWMEIMSKFQQSASGTLLYEDSDLIKRAVLNAIDRKFDRLLVDDYHTYQTCRSLHQRFGGDQTLRIEFYRDRVPMFERFNVEKEIDRASRRKVWLPSGGYLYFDRTEAMHTIDVNSGRSSNAEGDVEKTLLYINLEAAEEIARQLRLRNIGGLIIIDFIDMRTSKYQKKVLSKLKECLKDDPAKGSILDMSEFGLVEMTRQRSRESLFQTLFTSCPYCNSNGVIKSHESIVIEIERGLKKLAEGQQHFGITLVIHPQLEQYIDRGEDREELQSLAEKLKMSLDFQTSDLLHLNEYLFYSSVTNELILS